MQLICVTKALNSSFLCGLQGSGQWNLVKTTENGQGRIFESNSVLNRHQEFHYIFCSFPKHLPTSKPKLHSYKFVSFSAFLLNFYFEGHERQRVILNFESGFFPFFKSNILRANNLTEHLTIPKSRSPPIRNFYVVQIRWSTYFRTFNLWNVPSGRYICGKGVRFSCLLNFRRERIDFSGLLSVMAGKIIGCEMEKPRTNAHLYFWFFEMYDISENRQAKW